MARQQYKVKVGSDIVVEVHSLSEAAALVKQLAPVQHSTGQESVPAERPEKWTPALFTQFHRSLNRERKKILDTWIKNKNGVIDDDLIKLLGFRNGKVLGGTLSGFAFSAKQLGFNVSDVYERRKVQKGKERVNEYNLTDEFRGIVERCRGSR